MSDAPANPRLVSVNVGKPRQIKLRDRVVLTSIFKHPVAGRLALRKHNLEGDAQADLRVHGGPYKAIYGYPSEHYCYWRNELPDAELSFGAFGENLTTAGLTEDVVSVGDKFRIGSAILQVTQPRMPCFKLALRFERSDMVKRFWNSGRSGFYFAVVAEGEIEAGDRIEKLPDELPSRVTVADVTGLYKGEITDAGVFARAMAAPLAGSWKKDIRQHWHENSLPLF